MQDYLAQMTTIGHVIKDCTALPCNFLAVGHIEYEKDDTLGKIIAGPMLTGKLSTKLPMLFDEVYVTQTKDSSKGIEYFYLTQPSGMFTARSRIAANGKIEKFEEQNLKAILQKGGFSSDDKK
jgi:hypothetical protein